MIFIEKYEVVYISLCVVTIYFSYMFGTESCCKGFDAYLCSSLLCIHLRGRNFIERFMFLFCAAVSTFTSLGLGVTWFNI